MKVYKVTLHDKNQNNSVVRVDFYKSKDKASLEKNRLMEGLRDLLGSNPAERYEATLQEIDVDDN